MKRLLTTLSLGLMLWAAAANLAAGPAPVKPAERGPRFALTGYDPIEYLAGKTVKGNQGITFDYNHFRYAFANEKNKELFVKEPGRYGIQGDGTCPVVPDVKANPDFVLVYKGRIYAFATMSCMAVFNKEPEKYLAKWPGNPANKKKA